MMVLIYTVLLAALTLEWLAAGRVALISIIGVLLLATGWFLFHVYTPENGFRIPWLQF